MIDLERAARGDLDDRAPFAWIGEEKPGDRRLGLLALILSALCVLAGFFYLYTLL